MHFDGEREREDAYRGLLLSGGMCAGFAGRGRHGAALRGGPGPGGLLPPGAKAYAMTCVGGGVERLALAADYLGGPGRAP